MKYNNDDMQRYTDLFKQNKDLDISTNGKLFIDLANKHKLLDGVNNILDIGAGTGSLGLFLNKAYNYEVSLLEPRKGFKFEMISKATDNDCEIKEVFESSFEEAKFNNHYDLIVSIFTWFYIPIDKNTIYKLSKLKSDKGRAFIILTKKGSFTNQITRLFEWNKDKLEYMNFAEDFKNSLDEYIEDFEFYETENNFDYSRILDENNQLTEEGKSYISYFISKDISELNMDELDLLMQNLISFKEQGLGHRYTYFII